MLGLVLLNAVFSLSELAVVSARQGRLRAMAAEGRRGAQAALDLSADPGRFLSTVQIGITLVGVLAGAFSGAALGEPTSTALQALGLPKGIADTAGFTLVVAAVTYLSIVIGELVPKRLALRDPEVLACRMAPAMALVSKVAAPAVWLLDTSSDMMFRLLGQGSNDDTPPPVTTDDVRSLIDEAEKSGAIVEAERHMIAGVLKLGNRPVRGLMTPRTDVECLNASADQATIREAAVGAQRSVLPVLDGANGHVLGVVRVRDLLSAMLDGAAPDLQSLLRQAPVVPDTAEALDILSILRKAEFPMVLVHDEFGHFEGVVTPADLTEVVLGDFRADDDEEEQDYAVQRDDGSWLLSGSMPADDMAERLRIRLPEERGYHTIAGYMLQAFGHLPQIGEHMDEHGWRFEVVDMDGRRIDRVLVVPQPPTAARRPGAGAAVAVAVGRAA